MCLNRQVCLGDVFDVVASGLSQYSVVFDVPVCAADFGLSKIVDSKLQTQTVCGTPGYCC